jgi:uncharacterized protein
LIALFWLGLLGAPHCVGMCGLACSAVRRPGAAHVRWALHVGRATAYAVLGAVAGASVSALAGLATQAQALRPVWTLLYAGSLLLGVSMLWTGRQPMWLAMRWGVGRIPDDTTGLAADEVPLRLVGKVSFVAQRYATGLAWLFAPCGLLYTALWTAGLTGSAWAAALAMLAFAAGTTLGIVGGQWALGGIQRLGTSWSGTRDTARAAAIESWGVRASGLLMAVVAGIAMAMAYVQPGMQWCAPSVV